MGFHNVAFLATPSHFFPPHFLKIVVDVKVSSPQHVLKLWLGVGKGALPVRYFAPTKPLSCVSQI